MNKEAMYKITYGLYVLSAKDGDKDNGCIINTLSQVTTSPNRITVTVNKQNYTHDIIKKTGEFNVSILDEEADFQVFEKFGFQSGKDADKFKDCNDDRCTNGIKYLKDSVSAYVAGKVVGEMDLGTHTLFLADVVEMEIISGKKPMSYEFYQENVKPRPNASKGYICKICGYVYEGEPLPEDFICPLCKHGAIDFEKIK